MRVKDLLLPSKTFRAANLLVTLSDFNFNKVYFWWSGRLLATCSRIKLKYRGFSCFCFAFKCTVCCVTLLLHKQLLYQPQIAEPDFKWFKLLASGSLGAITCQNVIHSVGTRRTEVVNLRIFTSLFPS